MTCPQPDVTPGRVAFYKEPSQLTGTSCDAGSGGFHYTSSKEFRVPDDWLFSYIPYGENQEDLRQWMDVIHDRQLSKDQCSTDPADWLCGMQPGNGMSCTAKKCQTKTAYPADPRLYNMECCSNESGSNMRYPIDREDGFAPTAAQLPRHNVVYKLV